MAEAAETNGKNGQGFYLPFTKIGGFLVATLSALFVAWIVFSLQSQSANEHESKQQRDDLRLQLEILKTTVELKLSSLDKELESRMARYESETSIQNKRIDNIVAHITEKDKTANLEKFHGRH